MRVALFTITFAYARTEITFCILNSRGLVKHFGRSLFLEDNAILFGFEEFENARN